MFELIKSIKERDPACTGRLEVFFAYNGFHAVIWYRLSNFLWALGLKALARFFCNLGRMLTGIEIHPGAKIGKNLFIDHGTGVVIGETAIIGDNVTIYHGVTLGGVGRPNEGPKRHPTIETDAMIGAGAQVLGDITVGKGARIGSNSVVTNDIPAGCTAIGIPARVICKDDNKGRAYGLPSRKELDDMSSTIDGLMTDIERLKKAVGLESDANDSDLRDSADLWAGDTPDKEAAE